MLIIRIIYLDSLGLYRGAEASYFTFAALRLTLAVPALIVLRVTSSGLAWLFLGSSVLALAFQSSILCRNVPLLGVFAPFPRRLSLGVLAIARNTVAEPVANWVRLNLPVLVISSVAAPAAVNVYVALRAAFGASRASVQQLARVASVEYFRYCAEERRGFAEALLSLLIVGGGLLSSVVSCLIVADNTRLLSLWLSRFDRTTFQIIMVPLALSGPFYAYQILLSLMFRVGDLAWIARRHYAYVVYSAVFSALALAVKWLPLYLIVLALSEILLSVTFMLPSWRNTLRVRTAAGQRGVAVALLGSVAVMATWLAAKANLGNVFEDVSHRSAIGTILFLCCIISALSCIVYMMNSDLLEALGWFGQRSSGPGPSLATRLVNCGEWGRDSD